MAACPLWQNAEGEQHAQGAFWSLRIFMLGGAPEAHEVLSKTPRIEILLRPKTVPEAFPIKASDHSSQSLGGFNRFDFSVVAPYYTAT